LHKVLNMSIAMAANNSQVLTQAGVAPSPRCTWPKIKKFLIQQHLPLGLLFFVMFGFLVPEPGIAIGKTPINTISICGIFLISGLNLQTDEVKKALKAYVAVGFGLVSILVITPLLSLAITEMDLGPREYAQGLALFAAMPTTVSSGVLMTTEAKGNVALALLFSVVTNLLGVLTIPFFLERILSSGEGAAALDPLSLLGKLAATILLPLVVGKILSTHPKVKSLVKKYKMTLKFISSGLLISVPWITMSQSSSRLKQTTAGSFFAVLGLGFALHVGMLIFNYACCRLLPMKLAERKAVVINASQKTVNTAMSVIQFLPESIADRGLLMLPCIISHFVQTIMDAFICSYWKKFNEPTEHEQLASQQLEMQPVQPSEPPAAKAASETTIEEHEAPWRVQMGGISPKIEDEKPWGAQTVE
jgi:sodium/bile acid cotransporter 7